MAEFKEIKIIAPSAPSAVITHNLNNVNAVLVGCTPGGWAARPYISARTANNMTITFAVSAPLTGGTLDVRILT